MSGTLGLACEGRLSARYHVATMDGVALCGREGTIRVSSLDDVETTLCYFAKQSDQCSICRHRIEEMRDVVTRLGNLS